MLGIRFGRQKNLGFFVLVNVIIFLFIFRWFYVSVDGAKLVRSLSSMPPDAVGVGVAFGFVLILLYAFRLRFLIGGSVLSCFSLVSVGFGVNNILPFRIGDVVKVYFASRNYSINPGKIAIVTIVEKTLDVGFLVLIGAFATLLGASGLDYEMLVTAAGFFVVAMVVGFFSLMFIGSGLRVIQHMRKSPLINQLFEDLGDILTHPGLMRAFSTSFLIWVITVVMVYTYCILALSEFQPGIHDSLALVVLTTFTLGVPTTPGAIGLFEAAATYYLTNFLGVPFDFALASAFVLHMVMALPQVGFMVGALVISAIRGHVSP